MDDESGGTMSIQRCSICERIVHDGDAIRAIVRSVFHRVPSEVMYAIEQPSECYEMWHEYCDAAVSGQPKGGNE